MTMVVIVMMMLLDHPNQWARLIPDRTPAALALRLGPRETRVMRDQLSSMDPDVRAEEGERTRIKNKMTACTLKIECGSKWIVCERER